ncbi:PQQ-dependent sugar dehydrogenase [Nonomuraea sp. NPDC050310]|uniref:PQQ-dependent sugar dehydrogenase n=1 Tax=Nonomuraea sp. NPDC050310 TaxID=3154935 RepID=UPI0033C582B4
MKRLWIISVLLAAGCSAPAGGGVTPTAQVTASPPPSGTRADVVTGLEVPWAIAFLDDGGALVTERDTGRLLRVTGGKATELAEIAEVRPDGEGGLMGVAVKAPHVYLYYTAEQDNRIVRYRLGDSGLSEAQVIVEGIPKGGIHNGGRLAFGPDGFLYATTGEVGDRPLAQDRDSLAGKILRMTAEGKPAPGNPFDSLVYSYGHRNVQGLAWDDQGRLYASEFGASTFDEINLIKPGLNYGWPDVEGKDPAGDKRYTDPILTWSTSEASPSGMAFANGSLWVAALRGTRLWQVPLAADGTAGKPVAHLEDEYGRLRAVALSPGGELWVGTSNHDGRGDPKPGDDRIVTVSPGP